MWRSIAVLPWLLPAAALAATPQMVADLGTAQELETAAVFLPFPIGTVTVAGRTYFQLNDGVHGFELWATDGAPAGTAMVADICPGDCSGLTQFQLLAELDARVYLVADDGRTGNELWVSDGTAGGTHQVADLRPEPDRGSDPAWLTPLGSRLVFTARTAVTTCSVLSLEAGALEVLAEFPCGLEETGPADFTVLGDSVLFTASTPANGRELWVTDGTPAGTSLLEDIRPGPASGLASGSQFYYPAFFPAATRAFFAADDGVHGQELWATDGTPAGTSQVLDLEPGAAGSDPADFSALGGDLLFVAQTAAAGREVWRWPLSGATPPQALEITPGTAGSGPTFLGATSAGAFFAGYTSAAGEELYLTDGTAMHLVLSGQASSLIGASRATSFVEADRLLFIGYDAAHGIELWSSDGSSAGTALVRDANPGTANFFRDVSWPQPYPGTLADGRHLLLGSDATHGREPWVTDGLGGHLSLLVDADRQSSIESCFPQQCSEVVPDGSRLAIRAVDWSTGGDGALGWVDASGGAQLVRPASLTGRWTLRWPAYGLDQAAWVDGKLLFPASTDASPEETWISDGTGVGTRPLSQLVPALPRDVPVGIVPRFGRAYIALQRYSASTTTYALWSTDGTAAGSSEVGPFGLAVLDHAVPVSSFLLLSHGNDTVTLWQLDGATVPPRALTDLPDLEWSVVAEIPAEVPHERVLLLTETPPYWPWRDDKRLWSWSESAGLTRLSSALVVPYTLADFRAAQAPLVALLGDRVVFVASDAAHGVEPWVTDGTPAGTHLLADVQPGPLGSDPRWFAVDGSTAFFSAYEPTAGREIWRTDGAATKLALDALPGRASSDPSFLTLVDGELYFVANSPAEGVELRAWDPRQPLTPPVVTDLAPGAESSSPGHLVHGAGQLYFLANDGSHGFELWRLQAGSSLFSDELEGGTLSAWSSAVGGP